MYKRILVPLDGSKLAECALPHAEELIDDRDTAEILLVSVTEQVQARTRAPEAQELYRGSDSPSYQSAGPEVTVTFGKKQRQAQRYLDRIADKLEAKGIKARTEVLFGLLLKRLLPTQSLTWLTSLLCRPTVVPVQAGGLTAVLLTKFSEVVACPCYLSEHLGAYPVYRRTRNGTRALTKSHIAYSGQSGLRVAGC
jgi:nucleotide-binding universal stress UspA family protein